MVFRKNEDEVELKVGSNDRNFNRNPINTRSKMDSLFVPSGQPRQSGSYNYDFEEKFRMLEYKIEKVMEQTSRIIDLLEKTSGQPMPQLGQETQPTTHTNINFPNLPNDNSNSSRLW